MKRRELGGIVGSGLVTAGVLSSARPADAQTAPDPSQLGGDVLTPMGSERAGNAAGTIPAWTGGMQQTPAGFSFTEGKENPPDMYASDQILYTITKDNVGQYKDLISEGVQFLITQKGMSVNVYPTHRPHCLPQWVYDNTKLNVTRATLEPAGARFGFNGAYGGYPFPLLDQSDPLVAGAQVILNHLARWPGGTYITCCAPQIVSVNGKISLTDAVSALYLFEYYKQDGSPETYGGYTYKNLGVSYDPPNQVGSTDVHWDSSNQHRLPSITWQLLPGQARLRKAPEVLYDVPASYTDGMSNYDEYYGWAPPYDRYDLKLIGKQEKLVPYNNNKLLHTAHLEAMQPDFINPEVMRWELHRVWVVDATLHEGERNVLARRRLYVDEDTWTIMCVDGYDASGNLFHHSETAMVTYPERGAFLNGSFIYNVQTGTYVSLVVVYGDEGYNQPYSFGQIPESSVNPQTIAANASY